MRKKYFPHAFGPTFDDMRDFARELERRCAELEKVLREVAEATCCKDHSPYSVCNCSCYWVKPAARAAVEKGKGNL